MGREKLVYYFAYDVFFFFIISLLENLDPSVFRPQILFLYFFKFPDLLFVGVICICCTERKA